MGVFDQTHFMLPGMDARFLYISERVCMDNAILEFSFDIQQPSREWEALNNSKKYIISDIQILA